MKTEKIIYMSMLITLLILLALNYKTVKNLSSKVKTLERMKNFDEINNDINSRIESYKKKHKIRNIIVYILYGRKIYTEILFRYLDRNLKINGGVIDKIVLLNHLMESKVNKSEESLFLKNYLRRHKKGYEVIESNGAVPFRNLYSKLHDDDLVFKIDDDIVFIANGTFEKMVDEYFKNDRFILSANVINHHTFSRIHANIE